jgi:hypothetical protein
MGAFATITLNNGESTPVAHDFDPNTLTGTVSTFADRVDGISVGYPNITILTSVPSKTSRLYKVRAKIVLPVLETVTASTYNGITPAPTKAYDLTAVVEFFIPERSTLAQRKDIRAYMSNFLAHAVMTDLVETQETIY